MAALDIDGLVNKAMLLELGNPLLPLISGEADVFENAKSLALSDYWRIVPFTFTASYSITLSAPLIINMESIINNAIINDTKREKCYYLGVVSSQVVALPTNSGIDSYLLGVNTGDNYGQDYLTDLANESLSDIYTGTPTFEVDHVNDVVKIILSGVTGQLTVVHALGFDDMSFVNPNHVELISKLSIHKGLSAILAARSAVGLQSDFTVDTTYLTDKVAQIKDWLDINLPLYAYTPILWD